MIEIEILIININIIINIKIIILNKKNLINNNELKNFKSINLLYLKKLLKCVKHIFFKMKDI